MIPKTIHYCWFGGNPKSELIEKCIASWRKFCPDYEIIEWNESNFDVNAMEYTKRAYADKKWAFVSDVARLSVLYQHGGIYMDTDVEILSENGLDEFLSYERVLPFENGRSINTGMFFAASAKDDLIYDLLQPYRADDTASKYIVNTHMNRPVLVLHFPDLKWNNQDQTIGDTLFISSERYEKIMKHYGTRSWLEDFPEYKLKKVPKFILSLRNPAYFEALEKSKLGRKIEPVYTFAVYDLFDLGLGVFVKRLGIKIKKKFKKNEKTTS